MPYTASSTWTQADQILPLPALLPGKAVNQGQKISATAEERRIRIEM
jgi:hypothetical protein